MSDARINKKLKAATTNTGTEITPEEKKHIDSGANDSMMEDEGDSDTSYTSFSEIGLSDDENQQLMKNNEHKDTTDQKKEEDDQCFPDSLFTQKKPKNAKEPPKEPKETKLRANKKAISTTTVTPRLLIRTSEMDDSEYSYPGSESYQSEFYSHESEDVEEVTEGKTVHEIMKAEEEQAAAKTTKSGWVRGCVIV
jgi:hypothetical protein